MQPALKKFLLDPSSYPHHPSEVEHLETHISDVFLCGDYVYKTKKDIKLDVLDFSSLEKRRHFCQREVRLNKRFAPKIYLGVVPIYSDGFSYSLTDGVEIVEYAVKMRRFDGSTLFSELLKENRLSDNLLIRLVQQIAAFHRIAERKPQFWSESHIRKVMSENILVLQESRALFADSVVDKLNIAVHELISRRQGLITSRQKTEVRYVHGDLHLRNICIYEGQPQIFDGIEFNDAYACCDVWADIAFLIMDLFYRGRGDLASLVTNTYLEETDDFEGLPLLPLYISYRAAVRAKVNIFESQTVSEQLQREKALVSAGKHAELALQALEPRAPLLIAIGGFSGSGKTTLARELAKAISAIHVRSDVIRKHMATLPLYEKAPEHIYSPAFDDNVYLGMQHRAQEALKNGGPVILDAVQRSAARRAAVEDFASRCKVKFVGIWCTVDKEIAKRRVEHRGNDASDATAAVVERQYASLSSPGDTNWMVIDTDKPLEELVAEVVSTLDYSR